MKITFNHLTSIIVLLVSLTIMNTTVVAQDCSDSITAVAPDERFVTENEEVYDTKTGLIWKKCTVGLSSDSSCSGTAYATFSWQEALGWADEEASDTDIAWRLPNVKELHSLVEPKCKNPSINLSVFPNTQADYYWSSSPKFDSTADAWQVLFLTGWSSYDPKADGHYVRLVRTPTVE